MAILKVVVASASVLCLGLVAGVLIHVAFNNEAASWIAAAVAVATGGYSVRAAD